MTLLANLSPYLLTNEQVTELEDLAQAKAIETSQSYTVWVSQAYLAILIGETFEQTKTRLTS